MSRLSEIAVRVEGWPPPGAMPAGTLPVAARSSGTMRPGAIPADTPPGTMPPSALPAGTAAGLGGGIGAILSELAALLERLAARDESAMIDLRSLPMNAADRVELQGALGNGEVLATLEAQGVSTLRETGVAGVWWVEHRDAQGALLAELLEVTRCPQILASAPDEIRRAAAALGARNSQTMRTDSPDVRATTPTSWERLPEIREESPASSEGLLGVRTDSLGLSAWSSVTRT